jgi:HK97 family phage major capsid protein
MFKQEDVNQLAEAIAKTGMFPLATDFNKLAADVANRAVDRARAGYVPKIRHSVAIRGFEAMAGQTIVKETAEADVSYLKLLDTGSTPGSYLVPTIQAGETLPFLGIGGVLRACGARVWPMPNIQKLEIPVATATPTVLYRGQNTQDSATDPTLEQIAFDLKERRSLIAIPRALVRVSSPAIDTLVEELLAVAFAIHEDTSAFATSTVSNGPVSLYAASGTTKHLVGESANGGTLAYSDILRTIRKSFAAGAQGPFVWIMSPRTFFDRVLPLEDTNGNAIVQKDATAPIGFRILGHPVFVSPVIPENQTNGSGTSQSYLIFTNPRYLHVGDSGSVEIARSEERFFDYNQLAIRGVHSHDLAVGPDSGVVILQGIN